MVVPIVLHKLLDMTPITDGHMIFLPVFVETDNLEGFTSINLWTQEDQEKKREQHGKMFVEGYVHYFSLASLALNESGRALLV